MEKNLKRCRIWIPQWRVDDMEAWFGDMSAQGWRLKEIKGNTACFEQSASMDCLYYCHIFEKGKFLDEEREEHRKQQIEEVERHGWICVSEYGDIGVFRSQGNTPVTYPFSPEMEVERIVSLYRRTDGKTTNMGDVLFSLSLIIDFLFNKRGFLVSPFSHIAIFVVPYTIIKAIYFLISRVVIKRNIRKRYEQTPPHSHVSAEPSGDMNKHLAIKRRIKGGIFALVVTLLIIPMVPAGMQQLRYGNYPPIPVGELPLVRLSDVKKEFHPVSGQKGTSENFYRAFPALLLPEYGFLNESDGSSSVQSERYQTIAPWYAGKIYKSDTWLDYLCKYEIERAGIYGFDKMWESAYHNGNYCVVAIRGGTIFITDCNNATASREEILAIISKKAGN